MSRTSVHFLFGETCFGFTYCFLNQYSKELFDDGVGIYLQTKGRLFEKKKDVKLYVSFELLTEECQRSI